MGKDKTKWNTFDRSRKYKDGLPATCNAPKDDKRVKDFFDTFIQENKKWIVNEIEKEISAHSNKKQSLASQIQGDSSDSESEHSDRDDEKDDLDWIDDNGNDLQEVMYKEAQDKLRDNAKKRTRKGDTDKSVSPLFKKALASIQEKSLVIKKELDESKTKETPSMAPELDICGMDLHDMFDLDPKPESTPQVTTFKSPVLEFQIFKLDQLKKQIFINAKQDCDKDMQNSTKFLKTMKDMEENNSKVIADQLLKIQKEKEELLERFKKQEEDIAKQEEQYVKPLTKLVNEVAKLIEVKKEKIRQKEEEEKNQIEANYQSLFD
ncbi:hypothetical protein C9374_004312 [Naegleria lovaniensis]|uniref:Uncharacterized protein n=1 Tax=Naegleria lovaniensis TaxID=51637 RepID=A0AA88GMD1_NAELO|nr:uncharacterized protein C9374_004312 [Naegleria lovaniensis]KAG2383641.1 hypothetical protein C9374_004312 [Naegleria lovaniensis]